MEVQKRTQVCIVGGGPVGLSTAMELGLRGIECIVVEPTQEVSHLRPRAKTVNVRTMEHFRRWGIAATLRNAAPLPVAWSQDVSFCNELLGTEITRITNAFGLTLAQDERFAESGQQVPQFIVEEVLREAVSQLSSVKLLIGWTFEMLEQTHETVTAQIRSGDNVDYVQAKYLIGCDGSHSAVRNDIGVSLEGEVDARPNFNILFRSTELVERMSIAPAVQYWIINSKSPGLMGRLDLNDMWWSILVGAGGQGGLSEAERRIRDQIGGDVSFDIVSTDVWSARMLLASCYRVGRVFLAGDAAHLNPPWGGHGFNTGVGDAVDIGWKMAAVIQGWGGPRLLDSYEQERRRVSEHVIQVASENMRTLSIDLSRRFGEDGLDDFQRQRMAEEICRTKTMEFHSLGLVLGYRYDHSPVIVDDGTSWPEASVEQFQPTAHPGARLPHAWLKDGLSIYDKLGYGLTLLRLDASVVADGFVKWAAVEDIPLSVVTILDEKLLQIYESPLLLVRPDGHVAWRGASDRDAQDTLWMVTGFKN